MNAFQLNWLFVTKGYKKQLLYGKNMKYVKQVWAKKYIFSSP